jgi:cell division septum initiation protein DivIVA
MKQSSTVDWGDADESDLVDKIKKLEQENEELSKENSRLKRRLSRGESFRTDCTDPPTSIDSSERTAPANNIGASLRSLGSSITIPLSKMVRSSSEVSVPSRANREEGGRQERTTSAGSIIDATAVTDAVRKYYSNNCGGGTIQSHEKFQRRWSTGTGWKQKMANETNRRWGSCNLDDLDEEEEHEGVKGIGGWLGGFSLFGKADDELDDDEALVEGFPDSKDEALVAAR